MTFRLTRIEPATQLCRRFRARARARLPLCSEDTLNAGWLVGSIVARLSGTLISSTSTAIAEHKYEREQDETNVS